MYQCSCGNRFYTPFEKTEVETNEYGRIIRLDTIHLCPQCGTDGFWDDDEGEE